MLIGVTVVLAAAAFGSALGWVLRSGSDSSGDTLEVARVDLGREATSSTSGDDIGDGDDIADGGETADDGGAVTTASPPVTDEVDVTPESVEPPSPEPSPPPLDPARYEAARSAAVVLYTYGVVAEGYPPHEEILAPDSWVGTLSSILSPEFRNADCIQIVETIELAEPPTSVDQFRFVMGLKVTCPEGAIGPATGERLPRVERRSLTADVTVGPSPYGGYWNVWLWIVQ